MHVLRQPQMHIPAKLRLSAVPLSAIAARSAAMIAARLVGSLCDTVASSSGSGTIASNVEGHWTWLRIVARSLLLSSPARGAVFPKFSEIAPGRHTGKLIARNGVLFTRTAHVLPFLNASTNYYILILVLLRIAIVDAKMQLYSLVPLQRFDRIVHGWLFP